MTLLSDMVVRGEKIAGYKFLHKKDLHYWSEKKSVKVDTLFSYAKARAAGGYSDPAEILINMATAMIKQVGSEQDRTVVENLRALGLADLHVGRNLTFSNCAVGRQNRFVFCVSDCASDELCRKWQEVEGYDTVLKIPDLAKFALALGKIDAENGNKFSGVADIQPVTYVKIPIDLRAVDFTSYKFFKDTATFGWQREIRLSWPSVLSAEELPYHLMLPELSGPFQLVRIQP